MGRRARPVRAVRSTCRRGAAMTAPWWCRGKRPSHCAAPTGPAPAAARAFSPLDEALALLPGPWSPRLVEAIVRLSTVLPFEQAPDHLAFFRDVRVSRDTARRLTELAGTHLLTLADAELAALLPTLPAPPMGPAVQQVSADGAMVPLVGGAWTEAKLLVIGTVTTVPDDTGVPAPRTTALSYLARVADAASFAQIATLETHRRGTATA